MRVVLKVARSRTQRERWFGCSDSPPQKSLTLGGPSRRCGGQAGRNRRGGCGETAGANFRNPCQGEHSVCFALVKDRQGLGVFLQYAIVVEDSVSVMTQVSERITVHLLRSAFLADGWSVDVVPQRELRNYQPCAHGTISRIGSAEVSARDAGDGPEECGR